MSTFREIKKRCAVCKKKSMYHAITSTSRLGSPDLDLRPPEMFRSTMGLWVEQCPFCGYVSPDIRIRTSVKKSFFQDPDYVNCKGKPIESDLARLFYQAYLIAGQEKCKTKFEERFYYLLYGAWASDDVGDQKMAIKFRKGALKVMARIKEPEKNLIMIKPDLMRRARMFDQVISEYKDFDSPDEDLMKLIKFQVEKSRQKDSSCYTFDYSARLSPWERFLQRAENSQNNTV